MLGRKSSVIQNHFTKFFVVQLSISVLKEFMLSNLDYLILQVFSSDNLICLVSFKAANSESGLLILTGRPAGFFINFGRPKLAEIKNVQEIMVFPSYLNALRDN